MTAEAELESSQKHYDLILERDRKKITAEIEAELDARFRDVEPLENLMLSVKEREKQCNYLLDEISVKTAELVLAKEHVFAERAERMLQDVLSRINEIHQSIRGTVTIPTPGSLDDAKKGEIIESVAIQTREVGGSSSGVRRIEASGLIEGGTGIGGGDIVEEVVDEARAEQARKKGKEKVLEELEGVTEEEPHMPTVGKLLGSSIATHPIVAFLTREQREQQIAADEAYARALEAEFELKRTATLAGATQAGTSGSSQVPALASAPASASTPDSTLALASAPAEATPASEAAIQMPPPPPPAPKAPLKRTTPETREDDPAAKRQKMQQVVAEKASRFEKRQKKREEKKKRKEKDEEVKEKRLRKLDERIESHWNEVRLIQ